MDVEGLPKRMQALCRAGLVERLGSDECSFGLERERHDSGSARPLVSIDAAEEGATAKPLDADEAAVRDGGAAGRRECDGAVVGADSGI